MPDLETGINDPKPTGLSPDATTDTQVVDTAPASSATEATTETTKQPSSMAEVIEQALGVTPKSDAIPETPAAADPEGGDKGQEPPASDDTATTATAETGADKEPDDDPTDAELKAYKPDVQKRIKKLLHQRNTSRREAEGFKADAERYRNVQRFMDGNGLKDTEVADLFKFGALVKSSDPKRLEQALDLVLPIVNGLLVATGRTIPDDLRSKVDAGEITEDLARQVSRDRSRAALAEQSVQRVQERQTEQSAVQLHQSINDATAAWWAQAQKTDPDFGLKAEAMQDAAHAIVAQRGLPKTPAEAVEYAKEAHKRATKYLLAGRPAPKATREVPGDGANGNRAKVSAQPNSLEEAIMGALRASQS